MRDQVVGDVLALLALCSFVLGFLLGVGLMVLAASIL